MSVAIYRGKKLDEILEPFTPGQKRYIVARCIWRKANPDALKVARVADHSKSTWVGGNDQFNATIKYLLEHPHGYSIEAKKIFIESCSNDALLAYGNLLDKAERWDEQKKEDKPYIMQAIKYFLGDKGEGGSGESYDEYILKRHIVLPEKAKLSPFADVEI